MVEIATVSETENGRWIVSGLGEALEFATAALAYRTANDRNQRMVLKLAEYAKNLTDKKLQQISETSQREPFQTPADPDTAEG